MSPRRLAFLLAVALAAPLGAAPALEQLAADPQLWPAEVVITTATRATVLKDGRPAGVMLVGAGRKLAVTGVAVDGVTGKIGGDTVRVPVERTNLLTGAAPVAITGAAEPAAAATSTVSAANASAAPDGAARLPSLRESAAEKQSALTAVLNSGKAAVPSRLERQLAGRLVRLSGSTLKPADDAALEGVKYYALYFSAGWCGPCRRFTPQFVKAYQQLKPGHPEFEAVFVSADRSAGAMRDYMRDERMPWLAVSYDEIRRLPEIMRYSGPGIPCLVLVAADGRVLADSYDLQENYLGPHHVLAEMRRLLARGQ